jgi:hypothetical protein
MAAVLATGCAQAGQAVQPDATGQGSADAFVQKDAAVDTPVGDVCATTDTCQAAMTLGAVSGDTGAQTLMASGFKAAWLRVRVTEDDSGVFGVPLSVSIRLTSPANVNFDVFAYLNAGNDVVECTTPLAQHITNNGTIIPLWGETGTFSNGNDDSRSVSIEVRPTAGANCSASAMWQLQFIGNQ